MHNISVVPHNACQLETGLELNRIWGKRTLQKFSSLAMDGLLTDEPSSEMLEHRTRILAGRFVQPL